MQMALRGKLILLILSLISVHSLAAQIPTSSLYKVCILNTEVTPNSSFVHNLGLKFTTEVDGDEIYGGEQLLYMYSDSLLVTFSVNGPDTVMLGMVLECKSCLTLEDKINLSIGQTTFEDIKEYITPLSISPLKKNETVNNFNKNAYRVISLKIHKEPNRVDYSENGLLSLRFRDGLLKEIVLKYVFY